MQLWPGMSRFVLCEELLEDLQAQAVAPCWTWASDAHLSLLLKLPSGCKDNVCEVL